MISVCPAGELSHGSSFGSRSSRQTPLHARELGDGTLPLSGWTVVILCFLHSVARHEPRRILLFPLSSSAPDLLMLCLALRASSLVHSKWVKTKLSPLVGITCEIGAVQVKPQGLRSDDEFMDLAISILWLNEGEWIFFRSTSNKSPPLCHRRESSSLYLDSIAPLGVVAAVASRARVAIAMSWVEF
ncbi:hypothetical protein B0H13DRAFT_1865838 [Mycena leptocephala]|nr:hypothetical protein B0H13DRAFT_1865838 [Mycena leptocephala]